MNETLYESDRVFQLEGRTYGDGGPFPLSAIPAGSRDSVLRQGWIRPYVEPPPEPPAEESADGEPAAGPPHDFPVEQPKAKKKR